MDALEQRLAKLSPEKRALLMARLAQKNQESAPARTIPRRGDLSSWPLSFAQERLWFLHQLDPRSTVYTIAGAFALEGPLLLTALQNALVELVARHASLRTRFVVEGGVPRQELCERGLEFAVVDLSDEAVASAGLEPLIRAVVERPFDLSRDALLRVAVFRRAADDHVVVVTMHHIVADGWSMSIVIDELGRLYASHAFGRPVELVPLDLDYGDFAAWQRERLRGDLLQQELDFWRTTLAGAPQVLTLPADRPRPVTPSFRGRHEALSIDGGVMHAVRALAAQEGASVFSVLLAAFAAVLARHSRQTELCVGVPVANRHRRELEGLVGFFVNTLVVRASVDRDPSFRSFVRAVSDQVLQAQDHQEAPFDLVVDAVRPERTAAYNPLVQVMFDLQPARGEAVAFEGLRVRPLQIETGTAKFDLLMNVTEGRDGLVGSLEYSVDLFDRTTITALCRHYERFVAAAVAAPESAISQVPLLDAAELERVTTGFNDTRRDYPQGETLVSRFEAQVARAPHRTAVVFEGTALTYAALADRVNRLAARLQARGVRRGDLVAVAAERSIELVVALYAVLRAGAAYVPIDPSYPANRLACMLEDADPRVLLTTATVHDRLPAFTGTVVLLDVAEDDDSETALASSPATPEDLAYVIFTSGSTGRPKGVMIDHRGIVNRLQWMQEAYGLAADDRVLQKTPFSFDVSVWEFFWPLLEGATLVVARPDGHKDNAYLVDLIARDAITTIHFVPPMLAAFLGQPGVAACASLRRVICSGEALPYETTQRFFEQLPTVELHNLYGPTEASVDVTFWQCPRHVDPPRVPIGAPVANTQIYLLDEHLRCVPRGVTGELYIGGVQLARGYVRRPDLTAERFVPDPFAAARGEVGQRLYRTGDLARHLPDGNVEYLGRADFQVKIRGFRIELGEIEAVLRTHPEVAEVIVVAADEPGGGKRLVAYVVGRSTPPPPTAALLEHASRHVAPYMVPSIVVWLEAMPLSPNGKINRAALPAPPDAPSADIVHTPPRTRSEALVAGIWSEVLGRTRIGATDDFFALGGHSLLATQVVSRVRDAVGVELPLAYIFEAPKLESLAARIDDLQAAAVVAAPVRPIERQPASARVPLSFAQQRFWFLEQLDPGSSLYTIAEQVRLEGALDREALEQSFADVVARHEALRTTIGEHGGEPYQRVREDTPFTLAHVDLRELAPEACDATLRRTARAHAAQPFDLREGPLLRACLVTLTSDAHVLLLAVHHIVADGWSLQRLVYEVSTCYAARSRGEQPVLPPLPIQYRDFAAWQRASVAGVELEGHVRYWMDQLEGAPPLLLLPTDRPRPPVQTIAGASVPVTIDAEVAARLATFCQREQVTPFMALLAVFQLVLARYANQDDVVVGVPIAGRSRREIEPLIGCFVNTLVLRTRLAGLGTFHDVIRRVREVAVGAYAHQEVPFELLVDRLQPVRNLSHSPLFQVMFVLQNAPIVAGAPAGVGAAAAAVDDESQGETAKFDLTLFLAETAGGLRGRLEYNTDLFDAETVRALSAHYGRLLAASLERPDVPLARLSMLSSDEHAQLFDAWGVGPRVAAPSQAMVLELFAARVAASPGAVAVRADDWSLTYEDLDRWSNRVGWRLAHQGVGPETCVGLLMERSCLALVAILGVLKAGGAYVPLDPTVPRERLAYAVSDSRARLVVTEAGLVSRVPADVPRLVLTADLAELTRERADALPTHAAPEQLAYVIYTSGSTGQPKGVMVTHGGLANYLHWCQTAYRPEAGIGTAVFSSLAFDLTITGLFLPMLSGGEVVFLRDGTDMGGLADLLRLRGPFSVVKVTPAHLQLLGEQLRPESAAACTRRFVIGGEQLLPEHIAFWRAHAPETVLSNEYGPTETVVGCAVFDVPRDWDRGGAIPIGRPVVNTRLYVLDAALQPVPVGVAGELYIGGAGVARGYLERPDLTARQFLPDAFGGDSGARMYRTGDLVRWRRGGWLEFLGRRDHQVKIRGFRVELGEIEAALCEHPGVSEAAVVVHEPASGARRLVAYIVADETVDTATLRHALEARLPSYMVPSGWMRLDRLPLTSNGKVNRPALPAPFPEAEMPAPSAAPRSWVEQALAAVWSGVLRQAAVGIDDDFFELGGDSILGLQTIARARRLGIAYSPRDLFQHSTIARLAQVATVSAGADAGEQGPQTGIVPRTPIVAWFLEQALESPHHVNQSVWVDVLARLDRHTLAAVVQHLLEQHDMLRVRLSDAADAATMAIAPADHDTPVWWVDLSEVVDADVPGALREHTLRAQASLDLAHGPALRVVYFDRGRERPGRLLFVIHHLAIDSVSWRVLFEDFAEALEAVAAGGRPSSRPKSTSFGTWAAMLSVHARSEAVRGDEAYWRDVWQGAVAPVPGERLHLANLEADAEAVELSLGVPESDALVRDGAARHGAPVSAVLMAALGCTLVEWCGGDCVVDVEGHGRDVVSTDVSRTVGWFTTLYPVRLQGWGGAADSHPARRVADMLSRVPGGGASYGLLRYLIDDDGVRGRMAALPHARVSFNYLGQFDQLVDEARAFRVVTDPPAGDRAPGNVRPHLIEVSAGVVGRQVHVQWRFSRAIHERTEIEERARRMVDVLTEWLRTPAGAGEEASAPRFPEAELDARELDALLSELR